jgi:hypothetical protein
MGFLFIYDLIEFLLVLYYDINCDLLGWKDSDFI